MIFRQLLNEPIAAASYLIGCAATGEAAVVDPSLSAAQYALLAADRGLHLVAIFETHLHADYFSTGRSLAALTGATIYLPRRAEARFAHTPLDDGQTVQIGKLAITALHTPGHTPEHTAYLVADTPRAERPWFALSGDCLFVGDVGRPDLLDLPDTGPEPLYASIFERLLALPDDVELFPGHYGGSACGGKAMSGKVSSTIGFERHFNWALQAPDRATFAVWVSETPRAAVEDVLRHRRTNQGQLPLPDRFDEPVLPPGARPLDPAAFRAAMAAGAALLDLRPRDAFAAGHLPGALAAPYSRDALAERAAALLAPGEPLLILGENPAVGAAAAALLAAAGRNPVCGFLAAAPSTLLAPRAPCSLRQLRVDELAHLVAAGETQVLDVRNPFEWARGVIPGATLISLGALRERLAELPHGVPWTVICESGTRATIAASLLRRHDFPSVAVVAPDGMSDYAARHATVAP